jgi:hypothetical protein
MTRIGDVERAGIADSFHSDMPIASGRPLFLMHCGANRITPSGRVAAPEQCVSREGALRAVTIEVAYSLQMEDEVGSIELGKVANFTIIADSPVTCDPNSIKEISFSGTVHEGRVNPGSKSWSSQAKLSILDGSDSFGQERQNDVRACICESPLTSARVTALSAAE